MKAKFASFIKSPTTRGGASIFLGNIVAQLTLLCAMPLLSRLYDPADFGAYGAILTVCSIASAIANLGLNLAIPKARRDEEASALALIALIGSVVVSIVAAIAYRLLLADTGWLSDEIDRTYGAMTVGAGTFALALYAIVLNLTIRLKLYTIVAKARAVLFVTIVVAQIALAPFGGAIGLMVGHVVGFIGGTLMMSANHQTAALARKCTLDARRLCFYLAKNRDFLFYAMPNAILSQVIWTPLIVLLATLYGPASAGIAFMADRLAFAPAGMIASAAAQVFLGEAAPLARTDTRALRTLYRHMLLILFAIAVAVALVLIVFALYLTELVLGPQWAESKYYLIVLAFTVPIFLSIASVTGFALIDAQKAQFLLAVARSVVSICSVLGAWALGLDAFRAYCVFVVSAGACYLGMLGQWELLLHRRIASESATSRSAV